MRQSLIDIQKWVQIEDSSEVWAALMVVEELRPLSGPRNLNEAELDRLAAAEKFLVDLQQQAREKQTWR